MFLPDVNVLIYAFRADSDFHTLCNGWLQGVIDGESAFGVSPLVLAAVARITTNRRSYPRSSTVEEAFRFSDYLLNQPHCRVIEPGPRHWLIFQNLCRESRIEGPDITDAWYAALAIEHGCEWITLDRDFARFPGLRWAVPTAAG